MANLSELKRVAFSPGEFAKLFGKSQTWGYRQIYSGKVKAITAFGRTMIAAAEVEAILKTAGIYDGLKSKPIRTKVEIQEAVPRLENAWSNFLAARRKAAVPKARSVTGRARWPSAPGSRQDALSRLSATHKRNALKTSVST